MNHHHRQVFHGVTHGHLGVEEGFGREVGHAVDEAGTNDVVGVVAGVVDTVVLVDTAHRGDDGSLETPRPVERNARGDAVHGILAGQRSGQIGAVPGVVTAQSNRDLLGSAGLERLAVQASARPRTCHSRGDAVSRVIRRHVVVVVVQILERRHVEGKTAANEQLVHESIASQRTRLDQASFLFGELLHVGSEDLRDDDVSNFCGGSSGHKFISLLWLCFTRACGTMASARNVWISGSMSADPHNSLQFGSM